MRDGDRAHNVGQEQHAAAQDADQVQVFMRIIVADLCTQFLDAALESIGRDEDLIEEFVIVFHGYLGYSG